MDIRHRILLDKQVRPENLSQLDKEQQAELRQEAEINAALAGMRITAGMEPSRERVLAAAAMQESYHRENNMNPIMRLLSGRPWPARLAIMASGLLAIMLLAQLPAGTSYAYSAGKAIVFDLGVASSEGEQVAKQEQWERQSRVLLEKLGAIRGSAHEVTLMSSPVDDNLLSLSGLILVLDDEQSDAAGEARERARERFSRYSGSGGIKDRVSELQREVQLLSGGMGEMSRAELERAREELAAAQVLLSEVMENRDGRIQETSAEIERKLSVIRENHGEQLAMEEMEVMLRNIETERERIVELKPKLELMQRDIERLVEQEHAAAMKQHRQAIEEYEKAMQEHAEDFDGDEVARMLEEELESAGESGRVTLELEGGKLELELEGALRELGSLGEIRDVVVEELRLQDLALQELHEELQRVDLKALDGELATLELELREIAPQEILLALEGLDTEIEEEMQLDLTEIKLELEQELLMLEELQLDEVRVELQRMEDLKNVMLELQLPDGELLDLTMLEDMRRAEAAGNVSFRFEDHLFSFPVKTPARKMAATVNEWLKENGYDCHVRVELSYDGNGKVCAARAVRK